jgi:predicted hydrocarbon binding protein
LAATSTAPKRATLGDFMSITCFQYLRNGTEDIAGRVPIVAAGRQRGTDLVSELGLNGSTQDPELLRKYLYDALGPDGTRLCLVESMTPLPSGGYEVRLREGACATGVESAEPLCAYTLGVFAGALSALTGQRMTGKESSCAAMQGEYCIYQITPI